MSSFSFKRAPPTGTGLASIETIEKFRKLPLTQRLQSWYGMTSSWGMGQAFSELGLILKELGDEREKEGK